MHGERYVAITVECWHCKSKQKIHVDVRAEPTEIVEETILCINCDKYFKVSVTDKIIRGPFPA